MGDMWIADIGDLAPADGALPSGRGRRKVQFLGAIVSAASLLAQGEYQVSGVRCRRRPKRRRCDGSIRLGREEDSDEIHWACTACSDRGVITNWQGSRWDLSPEVRNGRIVSISEARARREGRLTLTEPVQVYELDVELIYAPVAVEERVSRRLRVSGDRTLQELHQGILKAFDREEDEAYEFMFGAPYDPDTRRFGGAPPGLEDDMPFEATTVCLDELKLAPGDVFGYLFDFSDEWVHRVKVRSSREIHGHGVGPALVARVGESPPQLPSMADPWEDDLLWDDVETTYPLTGLYGPYVAEEGVDPEEWLGLDEMERHLLVMEAHTHSLPPDHAEVSSMLLHAVLHVLAEDLLASLNRQEAGRMIRRHGGASRRHQAIHAIGGELVQRELALTRPAEIRRRTSKRSPSPSRRED